MEDSGGVKTLSYLQISLPVIKIKNRLMHIFARFKLADLMKIYFQKFIREHFDNEKTIHD